MIPLFPVAEIDGVRYVALPEPLVRELCEFVHAQRLANLMPNDPELLQARADDNKRFAAERFPQLYPGKFSGVWHDADGDEVLFTPHGYRKRKDVEDELSSRERKGNPDE